MINSIFAENSPFVLFTGCHIIFGTGFISNTDELKYWVLGWTELTWTDTGFYPGVENEKGSGGER